MRWLLLAPTFVLQAASATACETPSSMDLRDMLAADLVVLADVQGYERVEVEDFGKRYEYGEIQLGSLQIIKGKRPVTRSADNNVDDTIHTIRWEFGTTGYAKELKPGRYIMALDRGGEGRPSFVTSAEATLPVPAPAILLREARCAGFYIFDQQTNEPLYRALQLIFDGKGDARQEMDFTAAIFGMDVNPF